MAILEVGKSYQLYFRDPDTRGFKPLKNNGFKYQVIFKRKDNPNVPPSKRKIIPKEIVVIDMMPKLYTKYGSEQKMYSRKNFYNYYNIEFRDSDA